MIVLITFSFRIICLVPFSNFILRMLPYLKDSTRVRYAFTLPHLFCLFVGNSRCSESHFPLIFLFYDLGVSVTPPARAEDRRPLLRVGRSAPREHHSPDKNNWHPEPLLHGPVVVIVVVVFQQKGW
jgi:hypothetical protein